jgi:predicted dithiol-disulfide oxidoreductase (DUF899 family)
MICPMCVANAALLAAGAATTGVTALSAKLFGRSKNRLTRNLKAQVKGESIMTKTQTDHPIVPEAEWLAARKELLTKEKEFSRLRDALSVERRKLPWLKVEKEYSFDTPGGKRSLADLFAGKSQLIVYHFMFGPGWEEGCPLCSFLADHFDGPMVHLAHRDVAFVVISRAPLPQIEAFRQRMGWRFPWASSHGSDFNYDYHVSFTKEERESGKACYNYESRGFPSDEGPGASVFCKDDSGNVFHTYSTFARGLDILIGAYNFLDIAPKGRDEDGLAFGMSWVRHHDKYRDVEVIDPARAYAPPKVSAARVEGGEHN